MFQEKFDKHQGEISSEKSALPQKKKQKQNKNWVVKKHWHKEPTTKKTKRPKQKGLFSEKVET